MSKAVIFMCDNQVAKLIYFCSQIDISKYDLPPWDDETAIERVLSQLRKLVKKPGRKITNTYEFSQEQLDTLVIVITAVGNDPQSGFNLDLCAATTKRMQEYSADLANM